MMRKTQLSEGRLGGTGDKQGYSEAPPKRKAERERDDEKLGRETGLRREIVSFAFRHTAP